MLLADMEPTTISPGARLLRQRIREAGTAEAMDSLMVRWMKAETFPAIPEKDPEAAEAQPQHIPSKLETVNSRTILEGLEISLG